MSLLKILLLPSLAVLLLCVFSKTLPITPTQYDQHVAGKVFLLCGASSGIGEQITYELAKLGAKVIIVARSTDKLEVVRETAEKEYGAGPGSVHVIRCDMSDMEQVLGLVPEALKVHGRIDHVILNHAATPTGPFLEMTQQQTPAYIEKLFRTNVFSFIQLTLAVLPEVEKQSGHILATSSLAGELPFFMNGPYASSKHALNGFFYSLQQELLAKKSNATVSVAALGFISTKEITELTSHIETVPSLFKGDLVECALAMVDNFVTRARTVSYPKIAVILGRCVWWLSPVYHEMILFDERAYDDAVMLSEKARELSLTSGYQTNNLA